MKVVSAGANQTFGKCSAFVLFRSQVRLNLKEPTIALLPNKKTKRLQPLQATFHSSHAMDRWHLIRVVAIEFLLLNQIVQLVKMASEVLLLLLIRGIT